jgi:GT2 family glycosyltransferase
MTDAREDRVVALVVTLNRLDDRRLCLGALRAQTRRADEVGRLADYAYYDMDDCMRSALDRAAEVLETLNVPRAEVERWAV